MDMATYISNITASNVRVLTGLTTSDVSDDDLGTLKDYAMRQFNHDVQIEYKDWKVESIDSFRENKQDGSNKIFWLPYYPIGDHNDDGAIDTSDVSAYDIEPDSGSGDSSYMKTTYTVSAITDDEWGEITLSSAPPSDGQLYLTWHYCPVELETPHPIVKLAIVQLTAALVYSKVDIGKAANFKVGKVSVAFANPQFEKYMADYNRTITQIKSKIIERKEFKLTV